MSKEFIPVFDSLYNSNEEKYLTDVIRSGRISSQGDYVYKFEEAFAKFNNTEHGISVANGTVALETAYFAVGLSEGDEIIMPSFTIISCVIGAIRLGSIPIFVDVDPLTWCIDVDLIEKKITKKTKAILAVHMYGHPCDMDKIMSIAEKYNLVVIEDASQVHGGEYKKQKCGSIGHISTFSFYANKIISTGEGGMIITSNEIYAQKCRDYRNLCFIPEKRFFHNVISNNYRLGALQAAVGLAQLEKIEEHLELKIKNGLLYKQKLSNIGDLQLQTELPYAKMVYWMYCVVLPDQFLNNYVSEILLKEYNIETRPFFIGLHDQPAIKKYLNSHNLFSNEKYPVTELISKRGLYLPSGFTLLENQIAFVCDSLKEILLR
jgi:perosamine synthetase